MVFLKFYFIFFVILVFCVLVFWFIVGKDWYVNVGYRLFSCLKIIIVLSLVSSVFDFWFIIWF